MGGMMTEFNILKISGAESMADLEYKQIFDEIAEAYYDCVVEQSDENENDDDKWDEIDKIRNLNFRASQPVDAKTATEIMQKICPEYNGFLASNLSAFPDDCQIFIAREGSVCIYVRPGSKPLPTFDRINASEYSVLNKDTFGDRCHCKSESQSHWSTRKTDFGGFKDEVRIWWD